MNALAQKFGVVGYDDMEDNELMIQLNRVRRKIKRERITDLYVKLDGEMKKVSTINQTVKPDGKADWLLVLEDDPRKVHIPFDFNKVEG
jgi:hypothetical protein